MFGTDEDKLYLILDNNEIAQGFPFTSDAKFNLSPIVVNFSNQNIIIAKELMRYFAEKKIFCEALGFVNKKKMDILY